MVKYIIHIGYSKTGTTAVQNFLAHNRSALEKKGILYPDIRYWGTHICEQDHNLLALTIAKPSSVFRTPPTVWFQMAPAEYIQQIEHQVEQIPSIHSVLLSGESFTGVPMPWDFPSGEDYFVAEKQKIRDLRELLAKHEVRILIYLRRQDHWVDSAINQAIKREGLANRPVFQSADEFSKQVHTILNYGTVVAMWADVFGKDNIIIAPFEKGQFKNYNLIDDFLDKIGINSIDGFERPTMTIATENVKLSRNALEVKRLLNRAPRKEYEELVLIRALQEISREFGDDNPDWGQFLDPRERADLLSRYKDGNRSIAENYLGRKGGQLFFEPWPDPSQAWEPYPGLSAEKETEISSRLQQKLNSMPFRWNRFRLALGLWLREHALWLYALTWIINRRFLR